ncbi:unnamed protein product [Chrysoparadoxa australica]
MEVLHGMGRRKKRGAPPLLFIHGSMHGAWCWGEHWLKYFSAAGYECRAISLRGAGGTLMPDDHASDAAASLQDHIRDISAYIKEHMPKGQHPVIIGHSAGGAIVVKLLEEGAAGEVGGVALLCPLAPKKTTPPNVFLHPLLILEVILGMAFKKAGSWRFLARDLFFGGKACSVSEADLERYMRYIRHDSQKALFSSRPAVNTKPLQEFPYPPAKRCKVHDVGAGTRKCERSWPASSLNRLVMGAEHDYLVDEASLGVTAEFMEVPYFVVPGAGHDIMLGTHDSVWERGADKLLRWLEGRGDA